MRFAALSPAAWALGALALLAAVAALHLLRVRLRRVEVDTLLFFRLAGAVRQPRVLPGRPARLWAFLLCCAAALLAWTGFADPRAAAGAPSRVVVVEPAAGSAHAARLAAAMQRAASGLGPRGAVLVADEAAAVLRAADEPADAVLLRAAALPEQASATGAAAALRAAADRLRPGDELVWIGAPPPELPLPVPLRAAAEASRGAAMPRLSALRWHAAPGADGAAVWQLIVDLVPGSADRLVLRAGDQELASAAVAGAGATQAVLGPLAPAATAPTLELRLGATALWSAPVPYPAARAARVHLADDLPAEPGRALRAALALDPEFELCPTPERADVRVAGRDPGDARPCLVLTAGVGSGPRLALATADSPLSLSLRDRTRRDAPALPDLAGATVWVEDLRQGAALVAATRADGRLRVHAVTWLLEPATHADTPLLLLGALRLLAGRPAAPLAVAGAPVVQAAAWADAEARVAGGAVALPAAGAWRLPAGVVVDTTVTTAAGPVAVRAVTVAQAQGAGAAPAELAALGGAGALWPWLCALLLLALLCDAALFHRGRVP